MPALPTDGLRIVPLGGLGEIGRNMMVFEHKGKLLIVDCGVLFPESDQPGVDLILPEFTAISERLGDIQAVVLTHAHEDHIGAVPYLLRLRADIPLIGTRFTLALVEAKLKEHRLTPVTARPSAEGQRIAKLGRSVRPGVRRGQRTPSRTRSPSRSGPRPALVLHTGDFKMDQLPLDGRLTDLGGFHRLGEEGVDLLLSDSTNAEVPGFVESEKSVGAVLADVISHASGRIIVASFASHVHRVQQVMEAADRAGRHVALVGRSMVRNMGVAADLGVLQVPKGCLVDIKDAEHLPDHKLLLISTGSQGEPMSALSRMANNDHQIKIGPKDTVILASSLIPGNENSVGKVINGLTRLGANVVHKSQKLVHVSGHASAGELLYVLNALRPSAFMPVHGEPRHLAAHAALGLLSGVPADQILIMDDGDVIDLVDGRIARVGTVPAGLVYVDGGATGHVGEETLKDRRILGEEGFISVTAVVDKVTGRIVSGPDILARGFADTADMLDPVKQKIASALQQSVADGMTSPAELSRVVRRTVGQWVSSQHRRRPMVVPVIVEV